MEIENGYQIVRLKVGIDKYILGYMENISARYDNPITNNQNTIINNTNNQQNKYNDLISEMSEFHIYNEHRRSTIDFDLNINTNQIFDDILIDSGDLFMSNGIKK